MRFVKLARKNKELNPKSWEQFYEGEIVREIRKRYTINQELSILRQRDTKPKEFADYNYYVEQCKTYVKNKLNF